VPVGLKFVGSVAFDEVLKNIAAHDGKSKQKKTRSYAIMTQKSQPEMIRADGLNNLVRDAL